MSPDDIAWQSEKQTSLLFEDDQSFLSLKIQLARPSVPRDFFDLAKNVACHRDESRWSLLYSVAWRLLFEDRKVLDFKIDAQVARLLAMQKAIARDEHKMKAFVRFRKLGISLDEIGNIEREKSCAKKEYFVSWFEPEHLIVPAVTPFFVKRFNKMPWSILTPDTCAHWDMKTMAFTSGIPRAPRVEDELEDLWREYYANIFNPARLKLKAMQAEMPKKYWANLPEAPLISELTRSAGNRVDTMINAGVSQAWNKTAKSRLVQTRQKQLRSRRSHGK